ncbi:MAG: LptF/LptG family permease, partial [Gemmatimonadetes bacterium]|nr:LptF/LptG family permease [Gemmatimonadota bacterium]
MRILSRYVVVQFAMPFALSLLAFTIVFVVIDLVDRLSAFIDRDVGLGTILSYYFCYLPYIVVLVLPMAVLLAGLFCMGGLIQRGELLAMKSAGISLYQVVIPLH